MAQRLPVTCRREPAWWSASTVPGPGRPCLWRLRQGAPFQGNARLLLLPQPGSQQPTPLRAAGRRTLACRAQIVQALQGTLAPFTGLPQALLVNTAVYVLGIKVLLRGLTWAGVLHSWLLGTTVYAVFGPGGYALVCLYFLLGSAATRVKLAQKEKEGIAEGGHGRRGPPSVWGSGLAAMLAALGALCYPRLYYIWQLGFVASIASKLADTVSSEIGKAYGRSTYLVTSFQKVPRGTEGAVSLEGTAAGLAAAALVAAAAIPLQQMLWPNAWVVVTAAAAANYFESWLGASEQGRGMRLSNDTVNMVQICFAAGAAALLYTNLIPAVFLAALRTIQLHVLANFG